MKRTMGNMPEDGHSELLRQQDIKIVIDYFGTIELLDNIGYHTIVDCLKACEKDRLYEVTDRGKAHR